MNPKIIGRFAFLLMPFSLAGCNPMTAPSSKADAATSDPVYQKNPHPSQTYRITMTIEDAPGPFEWVSGTAFYQMTNHKQCTPIEPIAGVWNKSDEDGIPIHFKKRDASTYVATIYADGMVNADYYGKGACEFELDGVGISLKATGDKKETRFQPALFKDEIHSSTPKVTYFWKIRYPKADMENFPDGGETSKDQFNDTAKNNLFKVTLAVEGVNP